MEGEETNPLSDPNIRNLRVMQSHEWVAAGSVQLGPLCSPDNADSKAPACTRERLLHHTGTAPAAHGEGREPLR